MLALCNANRILQPSRQSLERCYKKIVKKKSFTAVSLHFRPFFVAVVAVVDVVAVAGASSSSRHHEGPDTIQIVDLRQVTLGRDAIDRWIYGALIQTTTRVSYGLFGIKKILKKNIRRLAGRKSAPATEPGESHSEGAFADKNSPR